MNHFIAIFLSAGNCLNSFKEIHINISILVPSRLSAGAVLQGTLVVTSYHPPPPTLFYPCNSGTGAGAGAGAREREGTTGADIDCLKL